MTVAEFEMKLNEVREALAEGDKLLAKKRGKYAVWRAVNAKVDEIEEKYMMECGPFFCEQADALVNEWEYRHGMEGQM